MEGQLTTEHRQGLGASNILGVSKATLTPKKQSPSSHIAAAPPIAKLPTQNAFSQIAIPLLKQACQGRLNNIHWFRTEWQRGGALTGYATYQDDHQVDRPVVIKLPVPPGERLWLLRLQNEADIVPKLYAQGQTLGEYDMVWLVMERLPHGPLGDRWEGKQFQLLVGAISRFYKAADPYQINTPVRHHDYLQLCHQVRKNIHRYHMPHPQRWNTALKKASKHLKHVLPIWNTRPTDQWCHGDLHLANAMTRLPAPQGPAILLDFALTRPGHWVEDAVYFEHLYWSQRDVLKEHRLCKMIAHQRKHLGLPVTHHWAKLASIKRLLLAMCTPLRLEANNSHQHLEATLQVLESEVG